MTEVGGANGSVLELKRNDICHVFHRLTNLLFKPWFLHEEANSYLHVSLHILDHQVLPRQLVVIGVVIQEPWRG